jgi:hypothetical protein
MKPAAPTPYPEINALLESLLSGAQSVLGQRFVGLYLYGSLASGNFNPATSDVDFLVVTTDEIPSALVPALEAMHARLAAGVNKWAQKLEGRYLPLPALRRLNPADPPRPCLNEGQFYLGRQESDWIIQRHILREQGVAVAGPSLQAWIDPVRPDDLRQAVAGILREWWLPLIESSDPRLRRSDYQAHAVLTMCRALHTLKFGAVVSKPAAARWAQAALGEPWPALIERALGWRPGEAFREMDATLALVRYTLHRALAKGW